MGRTHARVGQKGTLTRRWAPCGSRPRAIRDHRFKSAYLFGAVCPDRDLGIAVVLSRASSEAMDIMLAELSQAVAPGAHAAVLIDGAGYHIAGDLTVPNNITLVRLPSYSPELNAIEKLWQFMRENILSHRLDFAHCGTVVLQAWIQNAGSSATQARALSRSNTAPKVPAGLQASRRHPRTSTRLLSAKGRRRAIGAPVRALNSE
jgi:hypothetical protein